MRKLPILAIVVVAASCSRLDQGKPQIGLVPRFGDDDASMAVKRAIETAGAGKAELVAAEEQDALATQDAQAGLLIDKNPQALAVDLIDSNNADAIIKKAKAKRVPVVFFGREPPRKSMRSWDKLYFVGTRREDLGAAQGKLLAAHRKANPSEDRNKDGVLQFVSLISADEGEASVRQVEAASKALDAAGVPNFMLAQKGVAAEAGAARKEAEALISAYRDRIEAFICRDDDMALEVAEALKAAGFAKGRRRIPVIGGRLARGSAGVPARVAAAIETDALIGTAVPDPEAQGQAVYRLAYALARGTAPGRAGLAITDAKYLWVPCREITKADLLPGGASTGPAASGAARGAN